MNNLLIDIGNSDIKVGIGCSDNLNVQLIKRFPYSKKNFRKDFEKKFKINKIPSFDKIGISLLEKGEKIFISEYFKKAMTKEAVFIDRKIKMPIKIDYSKGLGNDRICNAAAVYKIFKQSNILIIDFGTATTYTLVSDGTLRGGLISPGIRTSLDSLTDKTSLPEAKLNYPKELINNNTLDNIRAGVLYQSLFSVERIIKEVRKRHKSLYVIATGGNSQLISKKTILINEIDENLVLKGINILISP